jgi:hypothetical protein
VSFQLPGDVGGESVTVHGKGIPSRNSVNFGHHKKVASQGF